MREKLVINSVSNTVTNRLRQEIIDGVYKEGEHITVKKIVENYGVSEMPVREAFQRLKGEGLLELTQYKGARILSIDEKDASDIYDIRRAMELLIISEVIDKDFNEDFLSELTRINNLTDFSMSIEELNLQYQEINNQFHYHIFSLSENKRAKDMYVYYSNLFKALRRKYPNEIKDIKRATHEHDEIIRALRKRDKHGLEGLISKHAMQAKNAFLAKMKEKMHDHQNK